MRVFEAVLAILQGAAIEADDAASRACQDRMAGRGIPFHGPAQAGVYIGGAFCQAAEFQAAARINAFLDVETR